MFGFGALAIRGLNAFARAAAVMAVGRTHRLSDAARAGFLAPYDSWANRIAVLRFVQDVPLRPGDYVRQLAGALSGLDFALLAIKTFCFGSIIALVTCYHGLAQPLRLEEVSRATVAAVAQSVIACVLLDALFIIIYLTT